jgi:hypothetical protein
MDNYELGIFLHIPFRQQQLPVSPVEIYPFLFQVICFHVQEDVNTCNYQLNLWRYKKFLLEWLTLSDLKRMLTLYKCNNLTENIRISLTLDRLIEK